MNKADECVYPSNHDDNFAPEYGLSKREYFATMAMKGILSNGSMISTTIGFSIEWVSSESVRSADALLEELSK